MTDEKEYHLSINADEGLNRFGKPIFMQFWCTEKSTGIHMEWNEYIADDYTTVTMRFDKHEAKDYYCMVTSKHTGAYVGDSDINDVLRQISKATTLTTQVNPYLESPLIAIFDVRKFSVALDRLKNKCPLIDLTEPVMIPDNPPVLTGAFAQTTAEKNSGDVEFKEHCAMCHPNGGNIINSKKTLNKMDREANNIKTDADIIKIIRKPGPGMTSFDEKTLSDKTAHAIAEYILKTYK